MAERNKKIGPITVNFPDENDKSFSIFEDCAELFGQEFQSDAHKLLNAKLKDTRPKPSMDYEGDYLHVTTANVDTIVATIEAIVELSTPDNKAKFPSIDTDSLRKEFDRAKKARPKPRPWDTGDVFLVPLLDKSFAIGQVLSKVNCTCALYLFRSLTKPTITQGEFKALKPISILHLSNGDFLNNGTWEILFKGKATLSPNKGHGGRMGDIGSISYGGCKALTNLANAFWGLTPWNTLHKQDYYDNMLLKNISRPETANILSAVERKQYRFTKYGIV
jgi:hypothetical protein